MREDASLSFSQCRWSVGFPASPLMAKNLFSFFVTKPPLVEGGGKGIYLKKKHKIEVQVTFPATVGL